MTKLRHLILFLNGTNAYLQCPTIILPILLLAYDGINWTNLIIRLRTKRYKCIPNKQNTMQIDLPSQV